MLRLVVLHLFQWLKRLSTVLAPKEQTRQWRDFTREEERENRWSWTTILMVCALTCYSLGGLGYYAKAHIWDTMTDVQKERMAQAMIVSAQNL